MSILGTLAPPVRNTVGWVRWARPTPDGIYDQAGTAEIASALTVVWFAGVSGSAPIGRVGGWTVEPVGDMTGDWNDVHLHVNYEGGLVALVILDSLEG